VKEEINYDRISSPEAIDFISHAMKKRKEERKTVAELCLHQFVTDLQDHKFL
jgi:hypothetical protein